MSYITIFKFWKIMMSQKYIEVILLDNNDVI